MPGVDFDAFDHHREKEEVNGNPAVDSELKWD